MGCDAEVRLECSERDEGELERLAAGVRDRLDAVAAILTRFDDTSELSRLNRDPRPAVPVSPELAALVRAAAAAGAWSGGLVDATLLGAIESAGYARSRERFEPVDLATALAAAPSRRPARPDPRRAWAGLGVDDHGRAIRPPGVRIDSGGLGKGLAADLAAAELPPDVRYAIDCGGDLATGPRHAPPWEVHVAGVRDGAPVHRLLVRGGVATSSIHARLWRTADGRYAHHVLDPATAAPAWTGLIAATAVGDSALDAEVRAKTALLSGPERAARLLARRGGVLQHEDGRVEVVAGAPVIRIQAQDLRGRA
jgi:thiamine biosynthesis lipoprotein